MKQRLSQEEIAQDLVGAEEVVSGDLPLHPAFCTACRSRALGERAPKMSTSRERGLQRE